MGSPVLIGVGAGLVSGVLFVSAATGSMLAMAMFYLAPMPGFLAGLGWGWKAAALAGISGTVLASAALGPLAGVSFLITLGAPTALLCYLALLSRQLELSVQDAAYSTGPPLEWYPPGRLVVWATAISGSLAAITVPLLGLDMESYRAAIRDVIENVVVPQLNGEAAHGMDPERIDGTVDVLARALPAASATIWLGVVVFNIWAAGRIVEISGRALRPWPDIASMTYPNGTILGFAVALVASFIPGILGIVATGFVGAFMLAYVLLGLVVVHVATRALALRTVLLVTLYLGILLFGWPAMIVAVLGIGDPVFKLRERVLNNNRPPPPSSPPELPPQDGRDRGL